MTVAIIDYGSGNLRSAAKAFEHAAGSNGVEICVTEDAREVVSAERIVLPGVGAFAECKRGVEALSGMRDALEEAVIGRGVPFLGICVGMQLMARTSYENGSHEGFGWIDGEVVALAPANGLKVPHMGWNDVALTPHAQNDPVIETGEAYFLHSYHFHADNGRDVIAMTDHGGGLVAAVGRDNLLGVQFHPEKSQAYGLALLERFLARRP